jgi:hypothetical protein
MAGAIGRWLILVLAAVVLVCGCGGNSSIDDPVLARNLLDAIYNGSMAPMQDSIHPTIERAMGARGIAGTGSLLRDSFGDVKSVEFDSVEKQAGGERGIWRVTATRGNYEMRIWFHEEKVSGFSFRPSSRHQWGDVPQIGVEYERQGKTPEGW